MRRAAAALDCATRMNKLKARCCTAGITQSWFIALKSHIFDRVSLALVYDSDSADRRSREEQHASDRERDLLSSASFARSSHPSSTLECQQRLVFASNMEHQEKQPEAAAPAAAAGDAAAPAPAARAPPPPPPPPAASTASSQFAQQLIEQKEREVQQSLAAKWASVREVERELQQLQLQLKMTAGPKKHALEMLRRKIEAEDAAAAALRKRRDAAKAALAALEEELAQREAAKRRLCDELALLVSTSVTTQLERFDGLKQQLDTLMAGVGSGGSGGGSGDGGGGGGAATASVGRSMSAPPAQAAAAAAAVAGSSTASAASAGASAPTTAAAAAAAEAAGTAPASGAGDQQQQPSSEGGDDDVRRRQEQQQQQAEAAAAARKAMAAAAAAARGRHVQLPGSPAAAGQQPRRPPLGANSVAAPAAATRASDGRFAGFDC